MFDVLIIGGGAAGLSCALVLGSANEKPFANNKRIGIIISSKNITSTISALFNNVLGFEPKTTGASILEQGKKQLAALYPQFVQIKKEEVKKIIALTEGFQVITNKNSYSSKIIVIAVG